MSKKTHVVFYRKWIEDGNKYLLVYKNGGNVVEHIYVSTPAEATTMTYKQALALAIKLNRQSVRDGHGRYWGVAEVAR